jgi:hypothetical protein
MKTMWGRVFSRVRRMSAAEVVSRAWNVGRREAQWLAWCCRRPRWNRRDLARRLAGDTPLLAETRDSLRRGDRTAAHRLLVRHFSERAPRFVIDRRDRARVASEIGRALPHATHHAAQAADQLLDGRFDLLGYHGLSFATAQAGASRVDWHWDPVHGRRPPMTHWTRVRYLDPSVGDHKIVWELNRHQHWPAYGRAYWLTGDPRYRDAFTTELTDWMSANPPMTGINWASMLELGLRSLSWIWALHFFAGTEEPAATDTPRTAWLPDLLLGLDRQLSLVEWNLSTYFSPNTHLIGEALALYVAGRCLPELGRAGAWEQCGRRVLVEQAARQINPDGSHAELSLHYHRYALDMYLLALAVALVTGDDAARALAQAVRRLATFARLMADESLRLPRFGDDDGGLLMPWCGRDPTDIGDSLAVASELLGDPWLDGGSSAEEAIWMTGRSHVPAAPPTRPCSIALPSSGYAVMRNRRGDHLVIDVGPLGVGNAGHAHADALSLTLVVAGQPFLIDPGTGFYTIEPTWRDRFRSTGFHNTLMIDGQWQSHPGGPFHWETAAGATLHAWRSGSGFDYVDASHDGYRPVTHRRTVLARPGYWVVVDWVLGEGLHAAALHWHLDPSWAVRADRDGHVAARHPSGVCTWIATSAARLIPVSGSTAEPPLGWHAPRYGALAPITTLRAASRAQLPCCFATVIVDGDGPPAASVDVSEAPAGVVASVRTPAWVDTLSLAWPGEVDDGSPRGVRHLGGLVTDARLVSLREFAGGDEAEVCVVDGCLATRATDSTPAFWSPMPCAHEYRRTRRLARSEVAVPVRAAGATGDWTARRSRLER